MSFTHLHVHDEYSELDGYGSPEKLIVAAKERGFDSIGITNHGNVNSFIEFQNLGAKNGVQPVFGCELYIDRDRHIKDSTSQRKHINVFVKNEEGYHNLLQMLTIANLEGKHYKPRIDPETLLRHINGLIVSSACIANPLSESWGVELFNELISLNRHDVYFEIMPINIKGQADHNAKMIKYAEKKKCKLIATNDVHYINKDDCKVQEIMLAINSKHKMSDANRFKFESTTHFLATPSEMFKLFRSEQPDIDIDTIREAMNNTQGIVEKCKDFKIKKSLVLLPLIHECKERNIDEADFFEELIMKGFKEKIRLGLIPKEKLSVYRARIKEEFELLKAKSFIRYFLIVWELINWCLKSDIMTGPGRGSCSGCLIAWLIGITGVDPLKYDLLFARFISPDRTDLPDIDIDFQDIKRQSVKEHLQKIYGINNVAGVSTFLRMKSKGALHDVSRVFDIQPGLVNQISKLLDNKTQLEDEEFTESEDETLRDFYKENSKVIHYAQRLNGTVRGCGQHAAGICISNEDLRLGTKCNLVKRGDDIVCNWDKDDAEFMGLIKLDVLGLKTLSELKECVCLIEENTQEIIKFEDIDLEDKRVLRMLNDGDTSGVFQLGSYGITKYCMELGIQSFKDVYNVTALYRPGPLGSGMSKEFIKRKKGEKWKSISPVLDEITYDTYGIIVYQEQVMHILNRIALLPWGTCDKVRKVIGKSKGEEALNEFKNMFIKGCIKNKTLSRENANKIWQDIVTFGGYGFNKCITPDAIVETSKGELKTLEEIRIGEFIKTPEGDSEVLNKYDNGIQDCFETTLESGKSIKCTLDHKFLCDNGIHTLIDIILSKNYALVVGKKSTGFKTEKITKVQRVGFVQTIDIEVNNKSHLFYANGIATSNSHSVGYSYLSMWGAWLKYYYPLEFYASCCTFADVEKKKEIIKTALKNGFEIRLPKFGLSSATRWKAKDNSLIMPFTEINGVAEATAIKIADSSKQKRVGFFGNPEIAISAKFKKILNDIDAFNKDSRPDYNGSKLLNEYFQYNITQFVQEE